jgi:proline iminopeptidase
MKTILFLISVVVSTYTYGQSSYYITSSDNTELYIEEKGNGEPVILLSGGPGLNPDYLIPVWEELSQNYRAIILNQRGTGKSIITSVDSISMSMENYKNDLEALRKYLKLDKITLIGHSWGAMLAMEYTSSFPGQVKNLILLGSGGPTRNFFSYFSDNIEMRLTKEDQEERAELDSLNQSSLKAILPGYYFNRKMALIDKSSIDSIFGQVDVGKYTMSNYILNESTRVNDLKHFTGKVSIIQGWQDPIGVATVCEIKKLLPQSEINFIKQCGHFPWRENEAQKIEFYKLLNKGLE